MFKVKGLISCKGLTLKNFPLPLALGMFAMVVIIVRNSTFQEKGRELIQHEIPTLLFRKAALKLRQQ